MSRKITNSHIPLQDYASYDAHIDPLLPDRLRLPDGWPASPSVVKPTVISIISDLVVDVVLLTCSLGFFAFALSVQYYDQASISRNPRIFSALSQATRYGPSVFPILFACVIGRASHAILVWRLEKGEKVGTLDVLASSTSLTNTLTSQLKLRVLSILGLALLVIWMLSPFGGQACLRQMSTSDAVTTRDLSFAYLAPAGVLTHVYSGSVGSQFAIIDGTFIASLIASADIKKSPVDSWGNVKVPRIEIYEKSSTPDQEGWFDHDTDQTTDVYASLVGLPLTWAAAPREASFVVVIEISYLSLDCPAIDESPGNRSTFKKVWGGMTSSIYMTEDVTERLSADAPASILKPLNFTYVDQSTRRASQCTLTTTYVEAVIGCSSASHCAISKLRRSRLDHPAPGYTLLQFDSKMYALSNMAIFFDHFTKLMDGNPAQAGPTQNYLLRPDNPMPLFADTDDQLPSNEVFATRLGQLFNGYWSCFQGYSNITAGITFGGSTSAVSDGTYSTTDKVIQAHRGWITMLAIASTAMIIASLVSPFARYFKKGPDLVLNISSLATRDSPFVALPASGSFLDAAERARLVKYVMVRFGDVKADADVDRLAIGTIDLADVPAVMPLRRKRLYI